MGPKLPADCFPQHGITFLCQWHAVIYKDERGRYTAGNIKSIQTRVPPELIFTVNLG